MFLLAVYLGIYGSMTVVNGYLRENNGHVFWQG